ncbi:hypothetical protein Gura_1589 [Geotalea uraniireducens Rf4]|uniref:Uncharacterized protein n=1 Tax=Geotalea uraniireducens (strain Rf4) TaxID=351605 RepID=A5GED0_GEOUR|nr:hypothetical protein Gura_1589 [Geotalea uraniireducens Rf4]
MSSKISFHFCVFVFRFYFRLICVPCGMGKFFAALSRKISRLFPPKIQILILQYNHVLTFATFRTNPIIPYTPITIQF